MKKGPEVGLCCALSQPATLPEDYLVDEPSGYTIVVNVARSDLVALVERTPTVGSPEEEWYHVIHVNSGVEG